jgi:hypothetical protein
MTLLIPNEVQQAIAWTDQRQQQSAKLSENCAIALDPEKAQGTTAVRWLRENGTVKRIGRLNNLVVVDYQAPDWMRGELKNWQLPSQGSRTPSNYVKWYG